MINNNRTNALEGTEFGLNRHLHRFIFSVRAAKAVVILRKCAGSSEPLLLAYVINTKVYELSHKVWHEPSSTSFFGVQKYQNLMNWPIYESTSMTLE